MGPQPPAALPIPQCCKIGSCLALGFGESRPKTSFPSEFLLRIASLQALHSWARQPSPYPELPALDRLAYLEKSSVFAASIFAAPPTQAGPAPVLGTV